MKIKILFMVILAIVLASCAPASISTPTKVPIPTATITLTPVSPTPTVTLIPALELLPETQKSVNLFVNAMQNAGVSITTEQILQQGLTVNSISGNDGETYEVATVNIDPNPNVQGEALEGNYPLMIKMGNDWEKATLKNMGNLIGFEFGAEGIARRIKQVQGYAEPLGENYNLIMTEGEINLKVVSEEKERYDFNKAYTIIEFAKKYDLIIQNHHLVPDEARHYPEWMQENNIPKEELQSLLTEYIADTMNLFKGQRTQWTVVNESFETKNNPWYWAFGDGYIEKAFELARNADSKAILIYNDYDIEISATKREQVYKLVSGLADKNLIDGVGMQMHLDGRKPPNKEQVVESMKRFEDLGISIYITEFDVDMTNVQGTNEEKLVEQATIYKDMLSACLESNIFKSFTTFGFSDSVSMYGDNNSKEALAAMPLPFDSDFYPKISYYTMLQAVFENYTTSAQP